MKFSLITIYGSNVLRKSAHVNASMVLTRDDHLFIQNYIRSLRNIILRPIGKLKYIVMIRTGLDPGPTACVSDASAKLSHTISYI